MKDTDTKQQWPNYNLPLAFWLFEVFFFLLRYIFSSINPQEYELLMTNLTFNECPHGPWRNHQCPVAVELLSFPLTCKSQELPSSIALHSGKKEHISLCSQTRIHSS